MRTVFPTQVGDTVSARSNDLRGFSVRRVAAVGLPEDFGGPAFAEGAGEGVAELLVFGFQAADAIGGGFQPMQQRGAGCALPAWNRGAPGGRAAVAETLDLAEEIVLPVEPGSGDAAWLARLARVMGWPAASIRRSVVTARWRVCLVRCLAAVMMWRVLSARIGCPGAGVFADLADLADHAVKVGEDLGVHFGEPGPAVVLRDVDQGERAAALFA